MPKDLSSRQTPTGRSDTKEPKPRHIRSFNIFPAMSHKHLTSQRYGDISPFFYFYGTRGDKVPLITKQEIGTFTMQSPIESDVYANRTYIKVNHQALYPKNWELMRTIKQQGQDVPDHMRMEFNIDYVGKMCSTYLKNALYYLEGSDGDLDNINVNNYFSIVFLCINILEHLYSQGSLLSMFNIHVTNSDAIPRIVSYSDNLNWDKWYDTVFIPALQELITALEGGITLSVKISDTRSISYIIKPDSFMNGSNINGSYISLRYAVEIMRNHHYNLIIDYYAEILPFISNFASALSSYFDIFNFSTTDNFYSSSVNIEAIGAYQLACAHFFTDDKIDSVYTSDLWFDAFQTVCNKALNSSVLYTYSLNGINHIFDYFNGQYLTRIFMNFAVNLSNGSNSVSVSYLWDIIRMLFGFRKSLKFGDYFTSARANVLSGDPNDEYKAIVDNGAVSAVSIARSTQYTRLRHNVNLSGSRLSDYLSGIFGGPLLEAERDKPQWLAQQSFKVKGYEVENTSSAQESAEKNIITTILKTSHQKFSFKTFVDDQCIILGLQTYDVDRVYANTVDRHALHFDRYDDFFPQLQFVGDQEITNEELRGVGFYRDIPWAYSERYAEYKRRTSYASGAYISHLPSYAFVTDNKEGAQPSLFIDSDYIRSANVEFDRFFANLSGWSLASYFHFRVKYIHDLSELSRNMVKNPQILK